MILLIIFTMFLGHKNPDPDHQHVDFMEMSPFCSVQASFELSISLFMGPPGSIPPFGVNILNIRGSQLRGILFTCFVQFDLYTLIFYVAEVILNSLNTSVSKIRTTSPPGGSLSRGSRV